MNPDLHSEQLSPKKLEEQLQSPEMVNAKVIKEMKQERDQTKCRIELKESDNDNGDTKYHYFVNVKHSRTSWRSTGSMSGAQWGWVIFD